MTVEGLQEWYDEACMVVYNNKYNDGVQWHDVACFTRARIICEDSELQMKRVKAETGLDVSVPESESMYRNHATQHIRHASPMPLRWKICKIRSPQTLMMTSCRIMR